MRAQPYILVLSVVVYRLGFDSIVLRSTFVFPCALVVLSCFGFDCIVAQLVDVFMVSDTCSFIMPATRTWFRWTASCVAFPSALFVLSCLGFDCIGAQLVDVCLTLANPSATRTWIRIALDMRMPMCFVSFVWFLCFGFVGARLVDVFYVVVIDWQSSAL
jgi:hypothetical protein